MIYLREFLLNMMETLVNQGLALGFTFAVLILLRPVTNRLLRPKYRVMFWLAGWIMGWGASFYGMLGYVKVLSVTFRGWITPRLSDHYATPGYFPEMERAGEYSFVLPGGLEIPFSISEGVLTFIALLFLAGLVVTIWWGCVEENKLKKLSRQGEPMPEEWHRERGIDPNEVRVRIMPDLPASFVCRISPGVHYVCLQKELPKEQMELVLRHELAHVKGSHVWGKGLVMALMLLYWWNPIMWVAYRLVSRDMELACDEAVLAQLDENERRTYARTLVELGSGKHLWGGLTCFGESDAEIRVRNAVRWKRERKWSAILVWPVLLLAFLFFFTAPNTVQARKESEWDRYKQGIQLLQDMREYFDDPTLQLDEIWERGENLLIRLDDGQWHLFGFTWNGKVERYYRSSHSAITGEPGKHGYEKIERKVRSWTGDGRVWEDYVTGPMLEYDLRELMDHSIKIVEIYERREGELLILVEEDYWPWWRCSFEPNVRDNNVWHPYHAERLEQTEFDTTGLTYIEPWSWVR